MPVYLVDYRTTHGRGIGVVTADRPDIAHVLLFEDRWKAGEPVHVEKVTQIDETQPGVEMVSEHEVMH